MHDVLYVINIFTSKCMQCTLHIDDRGTGQRKVSGGRSVDSGGWPRPLPTSVGRTLV